MKVFRKHIFCEAENISESECSIARTWPDECDGVECIDGEMVGRNGCHYSCNDAWCEEVCDIERETDREQMKDWKIGTEHTVRINGKDKRVVVCNFELGKNACNECALDGACYGNVPCLLYERTAEDEVYFKEVAEQKPLVLKLFFSPERNMTFTEHDINPDVGFVTGKYYRFIGKKAIGLMHLTDMLKVLDNKVHKCTNARVLA